MLFKIQNLGIVKEAEIDLGKDLILLCGQNNTGKTYVVYAIYYVLGSKSGLMNRALTSLYGFQFGNEDKKTTDHEIVKNPMILKLAQELLEKREITINLLDYIDELVLPFKDKILQEVFDLYETEYPIDSFFVNPSIRNADLVIEFDKTNILKNISQHQFSKYVGLFKSYLSIKLEGTFLSWLLAEEYYKLDQTIQLNYLAQKLYISLFNTCLFPVYPISQYSFPAQRSAINIFATELSLIKNKIWEDASRNKSLLDLAQKRTYRYSQPIKDNLEIAQDLVLLSKQTSEFAYLAEELENSILKGKITVSEYGALLYVPQENPEVRLEMHMSSSLVESLATISFYLRHLAKKNDCIMIDEPELNLHPDNQILIARFLGRLVNEGFKVIVSTHSDYIIRELSNLIILGNEFSEKQNLMEKYHYQNNELLDKERVGVYYFQQGNGIVQNVPISKQGIEIDSIDRVITDLNQRSDDIYYSFVDSETE